VSPEAVAASKDEARNLIRASDCDEGEGLNDHVVKAVCLFACLLVCLFACLLLPRGCPVQRSVAWVR
jgi:hypothetical protein